MTALTVWRTSCILCGALRRSCVRVEVEFVICRGHMNHGPWSTLSQHRDSNPTLKGRMESSNIEFEHSQPPANTCSLRLPALLALTLNRLDGLKRIPAQQNEAMLDGPPQTIGFFLPSDSPRYASQISYMALGQASRGPFSLAPATSLSRRRNPTVRAHLRPRRGRAARTVFSYSII